VLVGNTALIIISALSIIPNYISILALRILFGFFSGFVLPQAPKIIVETVPSNLIDKGFGAITNGFTFLMIFFNTLIAFFY
jgi:predicted MFS family arabinose efflux permease